MKYLVLFLFLLSIVPVPVSAHTLKIDGSIGVTTHVDPDDEPVVGKESKIFVSIEDTSKKFNPNNPSSCDCVLHVEKENQRLTTLPVVSGGSYTQLRYTFEKPGRYDFVIEGKPNGTGSPFQAFSTRFSYFVRGGDSDEESVSENVLLAYFPYIAVFAGTIIVIMFIDPFHKKLRMPGDIDRKEGTGKMNE